MQMKRLETSRSWQHLDVIDAKAIYIAEFPLAQHKQSLKTFESVAYPGLAAGYDHGASRGVVITGSLIADSHMSIALITERV
ncbi:MAG: hypothetical protein ACREBW_03905, partial [Candidatus Micrarchaeaceae archaeon]